MSTEDDTGYVNFLQKANAQAHGSVKTQSRSTPVRTAEHEKLAVLGRDAEGVTYTSDSDEPFEPVFITTASKSLPSADEFAKLVNSGNVEVRSIHEWDPRGQYKVAVESLKRHAGSEIKIYLVQGEGARTFQYILAAVDGGLLGYQVLSVES
jgi:hypothetical protein